MSATALIAALRRQREHTVTLEEVSENGTKPAKKVTFQRPAEVEMTDLLHVDGDKRVWKVDLPEVKKYVTGWSGFSEADVLGAAVGSSDPIDFNSELWALLVADKVAWMRKVAEAILKSVVDHINQQDATAKNSEPA